MVGHLIKGGIAVIGFGLGYCTRIWTAKPKAEKTADNSKTTSK